MAGSYCVTVTDSQGCTYTSCYNYNPQGCAMCLLYTTVSPGVYLFVSTAAPTAQTIWDFGDGSPIDTIIGNQITHTSCIYSMTYQVCMSVGCLPFCTPIYAQGNPTSIICGTIFNDANGNSIIDTTETGLGGMYLFIYGAGTQLTAFSDSITGNFSFNVTLELIRFNYALLEAVFFKIQLLLFQLSFQLVPPTSCATYTRNHWRK
jgi:hypothetical protein